MIALEVSPRVENSSYNPKKLKQLFSELFLEEDQKSKAIINTAHGLIDRFYQDVSPEDWQRALQAIKQFLTNEKSWDGSTLQQVFSDLEKFLSKKYKLIKFTGDKEYRLCQVISFPDFEQRFSDEFGRAPEVQKIAEVRAEEIKKTETRYVEQDKIFIDVEPGDYWILNPGDESGYRYGNQPTVEERSAAFHQNYEPVPGKTDMHIKKARTKVVQVMNDMVLKTTWGADMKMKAGGYVADGGYVIQENSFANTYALVDKEAQIPVVSLE